MKPAPPARSLARMRPSQPPTRGHGTGRGAALGVLLRVGDVLERSHRADTVIFGKTGTLTTGR